MLQPIIYLFFAEFQGQVIEMGPALLCSQK